MGSPMPKKLFRCAMESKWDDVIDIYQRNPSFHMEKITKSGQTALHIAVSDVQEQKVAELVAIIIKHPTKTDESTIADHHKTAASKIDKAKARFPALAVEDDRGNTPLHIAASMGSAKICECIAWANKDSSLELIGARNNDGETPFFLAALHGHKDAFLRLHSIIISNPNSSGYEYCRKNDGDTILHSAISGDYFDLAFQIIHLYKPLANSVNEQGLTPLHILATKPSAFRSGSHLGRFNQIIYHSLEKRWGHHGREHDAPTPGSVCNSDLPIQTSQVGGLVNLDASLVSRLKEVRVKPLQAPTESTPSADNKKFSFPENYQTCCSIISLLKKLVKLAIFNSRKEAEPETPPAGDTEDPQGNSKASGIGRAQGHLLFPPNYKNCFEFVKLVSKAMLVILGLGSKRIKKIREKKEKHTWSVQIMNELIDVSFDYEDDGTQPSPGSISEFSSIDLELLAKAPTPDHPGSIPPISSFSSDPNYNKDKENEKGKSKAEEGMISKEEPPAKNGLSEKVQNFLKKFPVAILATNTDEKVLLSVDNIKEDIHTGMTSKKETPVLIAAKNGITEMVQKILEKYPVAIQDMNTDRKNIVLLAVENRQPHVYQLLLKIATMKESVFRKVDNKGNSALHLAATLGDHKPWLIPGAALQMQWELKWYEV
ncbi:hypothetical protein Patl1_03305 [Pistacia atlantica]|uniref:Uncharacterized protein n=1 Tax=Pistacia atlantica TaxID=434234 RepID=A0ACC1CAV0_9ROSI|nr:hypothetical protein Patl1_03305 [Pistacia atlantica]